MRTATLLTALTLGFGALAQDIDCDGDIEVFNNEDAKRLSDSCETIGGNLQLGTGKGFSGDVVISGVERIEGAIDHSACNGSSDEDCDSGADDAKTWNLTMPDLVEVNGHLVLFSQSNTLDYLNLPKVTTIRDEIDTNARHIDLNNLERMGGWRLDLSQTKELRIDDLEGFTKDAPRGGIIEITGGWPNNDDGDNGGGISPNIFTNRTLSPRSNSSWPQLKLEIGYLDFSEDIVVAWDNIELLEVIPIQPEVQQDEAATSPINLFLGGVGTGQMNITNFTLAGGVEKFERSENTVLNVVYFEVHSGYQWGGTVFYPDFTKLSQLRLYNMTDIESMMLPEVAANWVGFVFEMHDACCRSLIMNQTDAEGRDMWYWPERMEDIYITGCRDMDEEFRSTAENVKSQRSSGVDCRNPEQNQGSEEEQDDEEDAALRRSPINWAILVSTLSAVLTLLL